MCVLRRKFDDRMEKRIRILKTRVLSILLYMIYWRYAEISSKFRPQYNSPQYNPIDELFSRVWINQMHRVSIVYIFFKYSQC